MGHRVIEKLGDLEVVETITCVQKMAKLDQMVPPECGDFFDHLQINSISAHMISCTNKARFPTFIFFWFFLNLYCALDWLIKTSVYTSRGHCKTFFSKFSFIDMFGTCGSPCKRKFGWFGGGGKNHVCSKTGLSDQMAPPECDDFFDHLQLTPILAHMISCTKKASFPRFYIFWIFY